MQFLIVCWEGHGLQAVDQVWASAAILEPYLQTSLQAPRLSVWYWDCFSMVWVLAMILRVFKSVSGVRQEAQSIY